MEFHKLLSKINSHAHFAYFFWGQTVQMISFLILSHYLVPIDMEVICLILLGVWGILSSICCAISPI